MAKMTTLWALSPEVVLAICWRLGVQLIFVIRGNGERVSEWGKREGDS